MKYSVIVLFSGGQALPPTHVGREVVGDLLLIDGKHPLQDRLTQIATVVDSAGNNLILPLHDAQVYRVGHTTMMIRGTEITDNAQQVAQEWSCSAAPSSI